MIATLISLLSMVGTPGSVPAPVTARPDGLDAQLVINSVPTLVREWLLDLNLDDSAVFYRHYLGAHHVELHSPRGPILAAPHAGRFVTVELSSIDARHTRARVSEALLGGVLRRPVPIPLPPDAILLGHLAEGDGQRAIQTMLARSGSSVESVARILQGGLAQVGMRLLARQPLQRAGSGGEILNFTDGRRRAEVVLSADRGLTWIMALVEGAGP